MGKRYDISPRSLANGKVLVSVCCTPFETKMAPCHTSAQWHLSGICLKNQHDFPKLEGWYSHWYTGRGFGMITIRNSVNLFSYQVCIPLLHYFDICWYIFTAWDPSKEDCWFQRQDGLAFSFCWIFRDDHQIFIQIKRRCHVFHVFHPRVTRPRSWPCQEMHHSGRCHTTCLGGTGDSWSIMAKPHRKRRTWNWGAKKGMLMFIFKKKW